MLQLKNRCVVVVGGGKIATRRIATLLQLDVPIQVISPEVTEEIMRWQEQNRVHWRNKCFEPHDIKKAAIVIAATNDPRVNLQVYKAREEGQLINLVNRPDVSDFFFPAILHRGKLMMGVTTSGASPGLSRKIKNELAGMYREDYEAYTEFLHQCRQTLQSIYLERPVRNQILETLLHSRFLQMNGDEREKAFEQLLKEEGGWKR